VYYTCPNAPIDRCDTAKFVTTEWKVSGMKLILRGPRYYSPGDEKAFFDWLCAIPCVKGVQGELRDLHVTLKRQPGNTDLRELLALLFRYRMNMKPLAAMRTARNAAWFSENKNAYWHARVFGTKRK